MLSLATNKHPRGDNFHNIWGHDPNNDIWEGRTPFNEYGDGWKEYSVWFGNVLLTPDNNIQYASTSLNTEVQVFIHINYLHIMDNRGINGVWDYTNTGQGRLPATPSLQDLSDNRIEQILQHKHIDNWLWIKICDRALELYQQEVAARKKT